jgi:hypothetical protein
MKHLFLRSVLRLLVTANVVPIMLFFSPWWWRRYVPLKRRLLQEPHGVISPEDDILHRHSRENLEAYVMCQTLALL